MDNKHIKGMRIVNGGIVVNVNGTEVEVLSHHFHNPTCDIVCMYWMDGNVKVELTYFKYTNTSKEGYEVYMTRGTEGVHHYYSKVYDCHTLPKKYVDKGLELKEIHGKINFDDYKERM